MTERLPLLRVGEGLLECALGDARGLRGDAYASAVKRGQGDLVAFAFGAEPVFDGHFAIGEGKLGASRGMNARVSSLLCPRGSRVCRARRAAR